MSQDTIHEPPRRVPIRNRVDVLVCGGGCAGATAALAAARQGARVALVEQAGFCGGAHTSAGVNGVGGWQYDLDGRPLIDGIPLEIARTVADAGGAQAKQVQRLSAPRPGGPDYRDGGLGCYWVAASPEIMKLVLDRMLTAAGVQMLFHASAVMPIVEDSCVGGCFVESKSGRQAILADVTIDCTGDGDIAARAGASFEIGRPGDGACQPMTKIFTAGNADVGHLWYSTDKPDPEPDPLVKNRYRKAIELARERGEIELIPNDLLCAATPITPADPQTRMVNFTRIQNVSAVDADDLTRAEIIGREQVREAMTFLRKYVRNSRDAYLIATAGLGIRESRRIVGEYVLNGEDVRNSRSFADQVVRGIYLLDIHNPTEVGKPSVLEMLDAPYGIPYRCLLPQGVQGLLLAGRCISGDHVAHASYRIQSHCMAMGQAAGTAAAMAVRRGIPARDLPAEELREQLTADGANVGPEGHP
jgi:2-polyprenyl-6-methoxyphenol hydroxylase-like FAD-dependent oxidoreductase